MRTILTALALLAVTPAYGAVLCVNQGGTGGCFATIQAAVDAAVRGDEIDVAAGTYAELVLIPPGERHTIRGAGATMTTVDGGIQVDPGAHLTVADLGITGAGQGLEVRLADATAERVVAFANEASGFYVFQGRLDLSECTSSGNGLRGIHANNLESSGPGRASHVRVVRSTVASNTGEGILVSGSRVTVEDSTISTNGRRGIETDLQRNLVRIRRSTITGNQSTSRGGGLTVNHVTSLVLQSTIVAGNTAAVAGNDVYDFGFKSRFRSLGFNLIGDPVGTEDMSGRTDLDLVGVDPLLDVLADNGGPTETHELGAGSPALAAVARGLLCRQPDQRGVPRAAPCDIGAFEAP
jgi:hypothetical protein